MNNPNTPMRFPALRYRDFRLLWMGQTLSTVGTQMQWVALNWHIYLLTHSPLALGLIGLARFIPILLFSPIGGATADTYNRKKIFFITQSILTALTAVLVVTTHIGVINPFIIYGITACVASLAPFDGSSRQALIPSLVDRKHLANAMSLNVIAMQVATIVGPAITGFLIAQSGVEIVYILNMLSYIAVFYALFLMKATGAILGAPSTVSFAAIKEGLHFVRHQTIIWSTMLLDFFGTFFSSATALLPIYAKDILHVGPQGLGILYAAPSIGAVLAGYSIAHLGTLRKEGKILLISISAYAVGTILFGLSKNLYLSLFALFVVGAGDSISTIIRNTIRQLQTPDYIRGRMTSINMIFFMGGPQLGEFEAGSVAALIGAPLSVITGGIGTLIAVGLVAYLIPRLRNYDAHNSSRGDPIIP